MKKLKIGFVAVLIVTLLCGLCYRAFSGTRKTERTEFLLDTYCTITAFHKDADAALDAAFDEIARIHSLTNFFDETSDVSKINRAKQGEKVRVDEAVISIINTARDMKAASDGAFDVCIAPVSVLWKFDEGEPRPPKDDEIEDALLTVKDGGIVVNNDDMTVTKKTDSTKIDLGGVAKGYAGDAAMRVLREHGVECAVIDLGGNIVCFGENPNSKDGKWRIGLQEPFAPTGEYERIVELTQGTVVTSGTYQRYFTHNDKIYHHIIDPETGYPAKQEYQSVTVVTEDSAVADCLATAVYVLGRDEGVKLAQRYGAEVYFE